MTDNTTGDGATLDKSLALWMLEQTNLSVHEIVIDGDESWESSGGEVTFLVSRPDGVWRVVVFNDAGDWDYVDSVTAPDGRRWYWDTDAAEPPGPLTDWQPSPDMREIWLQAKVNSAQRGR